MRTLQQILKDSDEQEFLLLCYMNFRVFFTRVLGYKWDEFLEEANRLIDIYDKVCIQAPRGHGKTTLILAKLIHFACFNTNKDMLIVSDKKEQAIANLQEFINMVEDNELLIKILKPLTLKETWSKTAIVTKTKCRVFVKANSPAVRGGHYNFVMCDEGGEYRDLTNFYGVVEPTVFAKKGKMVVIGTPTSKMDLLSELSSEESAYASKVYRAIKDDGAPLSSRFTIEELNQKKKQLENAGKYMEWEREFMCNPVSDETSLFNYTSIRKGFDKEALMLNNGEPNKRYFMGVDFASSGRSRADFSVFTIIEVDEKENRRVVRIERVKGESFQAQLNRFCNIYEKFNVVKAMIDESNLGWGFLEVFKEKSMIVEGFSFKSDARNDLLVRLSTLFENGKIILPYNKKDTYGYELTRTLISELLSFSFQVTPTTRKGTWKSTGAHDDCVMSLGLAMEAAGRKYGAVSLKFI